MFLPCAYAVTPEEMLSDPVLETRARTITSELRCLVCQNQSIDDSDASLARDLRVLVRDKLKEGLSDAQIRQFVHERYGDFVLLRPPVKMTTLFLWLTPLVALFAGVFVVWSAARRPRVGLDPNGHLTEDERRRLTALGVGGNSDLPSRD
jgi:cytochrome c-type biogenesis protein CcmH